MPSLNIKKIVATWFFAWGLSSTAPAAVIALVNSPTANATFNTNFQAFIEARGDTFIRNPASYTGVNVVFNIRQPVSADLANFVRGGGLMITEYSGITNAGTAGLLNYSDSGGGNAGTGTSVTFTATGQSLGLNAGLSNPYSDGGATEFFRNNPVAGLGVSILATRGASIPAIVGAHADSGYVLGIMYDWGDAFVTTPPTSATSQLITNALTVAVPEPGAWALISIAAVASFGMLRRKMHLRQV